MALEDEAESARAFEGVGAGAGSRESHGRLDQAVGKVRHIAEDVRNSAGRVIERTREEIAEHLPAPSDPLGSIAVLARRATAVATNRASAGSEDAEAASDDTDVPTVQRPALPGTQSGVASATRTPRMPTAKANVRTIPYEGGWANEREGATRVTKIFPTKAGAKAAGRVTAQREKVEHVILNRDGTVAERNSYRNNPAPRRT
jgi:hypothetical protein